jgi:hypothetical protein
MRNHSQKVGHKGDAQACSSCQVSGAQGADRQHRAMGFQLARWPGCQGGSTRQRVTKTQREGAVGSGRGGKTDAEVTSNTTLVTEKQTQCQPTETQMT